MAPKYLAEKTVSFSHISLQNCPVVFPICLAGPKGSSQYNIQCYVCLRLKISMRWSGGLN